MKSFDRVIITVIAVMLGAAAAVNVFIFSSTGKSDNSYMVDIKRVQRELESFGSADLSDHPYIIAITEYSPDDKDFFTRQGSYVCFETSNGLYRIDYKTDNGDMSGSMAVIVNTVLAVFFAIVLITLFYVRNKIIKPFTELSELPLKLAKGNLTVPLKENKSRYFGRFIWGSDMLREALEQQRERELKLQKDKQTLILSLSHDIKTPLSAIKLYNRALQKGLYKDDEKKASVYDSIDENVLQIEGFLAELKKTASEDFLALEVNMGECYLSEIIDKISAHYNDKLDDMHTVFSVGGFSDCLLKADADRTVEVLQNLCENAIKYGDGKRIELSFSSEESYRIISVTNTGCTLSDDEAAHIFDSFWRGSNVGSKPGSGLGLYIARQLMHKMGGDIYAETGDDSFTVSVVIGTA